MEYYTAIGIDVSDKTSRYGHRIKNRLFPYGAPEAMAEVRLRALGFLYIILFTAVEKEFRSL